MMIYAGYIQTHLIEKPLVIIVPSFNNNEKHEDTERYRLNLDSIFSQEYSNYRVIYIDDCSTDGTADRVEGYVQEKGQKHRFTLIKNMKRWGPSRNRYVGVHQCDDDEIVMFLDGDDWFAHRSVLKLINEIYNDPDIWFTYSHFRHSPDDGTLSGGIQIPEDVVNNNSYRSYGWHYHSLKTFYAWLFKRVHLEDLLYQGNFLPIASDMVETFPLVEMSGGRFKFIEDVLYIASVHQSNEMKIAGWNLFQTMYQHIVTMKPYKPLIEKPNTSSQTLDRSVDCIWFCHTTNFEQLIEPLQDFTKYMCGLGTLYLILDNDISAESVANLLVPLAQNFNCHLIIKSLSILTHQDFFEALSDHLVLTSEDIAPCMPIDLKRISSFLDKTHAYAFYCSNSAEQLQTRHDIPCFHITFDLQESDRMYIFQCGISKKAFRSFNTFNCSIVNKATFEDIIAHCQGDSVEDYIKHMEAITPQESRIACVYELPHTVSMDLI